jgi:hypothetical protein
MTHPITPPLELVQRLYGLPQMTAIETAFQAGADQELEACCDELDEINCEKYWSQRLRAARRPKSPSLKLQALNDLNAAYNKNAIDDTTYWNIRRALEALPND